MKIINIGAYPPPYGGISNHLKRLLEYLLKNEKDTTLIDMSGIDKNIDNVFCLRLLPLYCYLFFKQKKAIIHYHNYDQNLKELVAIFLMSFKHVIVWSFHNERFVNDINNRRLLVRIIIKLIFLRVRKVIVDSKSNKQLFSKTFKKNHNVVVIPEFIPPVNIPDLNNNQIETLRKKHKYIIASNAWKIRFHNNVDLYGIDLIVELGNILINEKNIDLAITFLLPDIGEDNYFTKLRKTIIKYKLTERFVFITEPLDEASSLWKISDLIIRATSSDGNSLTVLESLSLKIPTIASDCVERPEGVILFSNRNLEDLVIKTEDVINNLNTYKKKITNLKIQNNAEKFLKLYENIR